MNIDCTYASIFNNTNVQIPDYQSINYNVNNTLPKTNKLANSRRNNKYSSIYDNKNQAQIANIDYLLHEISTQFVDLKMTNQELTKFVSSKFISSLFTKSNTDEKESKTKKANLKNEKKLQSKNEKSTNNDPSEDSNECSISIKHTKFSLEEDLMLKKIVFTFGPKNWRLIASLMPGRTSKQCRDRYANYLAPGFIRKEWTVEEDNLLENKFNLYGPKWALISSFFPYRSSNDIKNRYNNVISKKINSKKSSESKNSSSTIVVEEKQNKDLENDPFDIFFNGNEIDQDQFYSFEDMFSINGLDNFI